MIDISSQILNIVFQNVDTVSERHMPESEGKVIRRRRRRGRFAFIIRSSTFATSATVSVSSVSAPAHISAPVPSPSPPSPSATAVLITAFAIPVFSADSHINVIISDITTDSESITIGTQCTASTVTDALPMPPAAALRTATRHRWPTPAPWRRMGIRRRITCCWVWVVISRCGGIICWRAHIVVAGRNHESSRGRTWMDWHCGRNVRAHAP
jgi:hypothetical protein